MKKPPSSASAIELLQSHSLATLVRSELERRILVGEIAPGAKLAEADIAGELNVSRGPVREAFRALEQAGLVRTEKNRGVFVREVSLQEADEIYEVRAGLDELIGRLAAQRITAAQLADLRELLRKMQQAARLKSVDDYYPLNLRFHAMLAGFAGNRAEVKGLFPGCTEDQYTLMALGNLASHGSTKGCTEYKQDYIDYIMPAYKEYSAAAGYAAHPY